MRIKATMTRVLLPSAALGMLLLVACGGERSRSNPTPSTEASQLNVRTYTLPYELAGRPGAGLTWLVVDVDILARGARGIPASFDKFSLETNAASYPAIESSSSLENGCDASTIALPSQTRYCRVAFRVTIGETPHAIYLAVNGPPMAATFERISGPPSLCATASPENTVEACTDGCNNDGDGFFDCNDRDCCPVLGACASDTYCGRNTPACVMGEEGALTTCLDHCDNDGDGAMDCNEAACCDILACPERTVCGVTANPFEGAVRFRNDLATIDPSKLLAGEAPCRAPTLVRVEYVNDGDTVRVFSVDSGGVEGPVRMIGVDTPEIGRDGAPNDCYAVEASDFTQQLEGRLVWLTFDAECFDQYDRNLAYVHIGPERSDLWQRQLVRRGFATVYTVRGNDALADLYEHDQTVAEAANLGLHAACP